MSTEDSVAGLYDEVRIKAFRKPVHFEADETNIRAPRVGDVVTIIELYQQPLGYELECSGPGGITEWLLAFRLEDTELEKLD